MSGIVDAFNRQDAQDVVVIGELIEHSLNGDFGRLLKAMLENLKAMELANSRNNAGSSDKVLGRLEAYDTVLGDLHGFIARKNELQLPREEESSEETEMASEPFSAPRGGEI